MTTDVSELQLLKALEPIEVTEDGMEISVTFRQPMKAPSAMVVIPSGMIILQA